MAANKSSASLFAKIIPLLFFVVMIWLIVSTVSFAFKAFYSFLALPLLLIALFLNYSVVTDYVSKLFQDIKDDAGKGIIKLIGNVVFYPFVFGYLALKAYGKRAVGAKRPSVKKQKETKKGDYIKYEEVDNEDFLELEDIDKPKSKVKVKQTKSNNDYDDLFT